MNEYQAAKLAADIASDSLHALRQAEFDTAPFIGRPAMAFDSAAAVYKHALGECGVSAVELRGLSADELRIVWKNLPKPGQRQPFRRPSAAVGMAMDGASDGKLDSILRGAGAPVDLSSRHDFRY
jgi:hypothetical protein